MFEKVDGVKFKSTMAKWPARKRLSGYLTEMLKSKLNRYSMVTV